MMTTKLPAVTIGIPFYNAEATLLDAVRSVFAQTHQDWELILLDDGSTDCSLELARSIRDPRVKVYSDGQNRRLAARLNQMTHLAKCDFIARMDADDLMTPDRIEKLLSILQLHQEYDLVSCGTYTINSDSILKGYRGKAEFAYTFDCLLRKSQGFLHAGLVARKSWYERNKYDESASLIEDTYLWLCAAKAGDFRALSIAEPLYIYREEGAVTEHKLLGSYRLERSKIAPLIANTLNKNLYILRSIMKSSLVMTIKHFNLLRYLLKLRNTVEVNDQMLKEFTSACDKIAATKIPGVDHT